MGAKTDIAWTDATWNFFTGCQAVSAGCDHCYAHVFANRWSGTKDHYFENGFNPTNRPDMMNLPTTWKAHKKIFTLSMSDMFYNAIPPEVLRQSYDVMKACPWHVFQVLTKRPEPMRRLVPVLAPSIMKNVWYGVTVENNTAGWRVPMLLETSAYIRFLSIEPMIGPVDQVPIEGLDWIIVGGESGHGARPMDLQWARNLRDRCRARGIPFFFKQLGNHAAKEMGLPTKNKGDKLHELPDDLQIREFPKNYDKDHYVRLAQEHLAKIKATMKPKNQLLLT